MRKVRRVTSGTSGVGVFLKDLRRSRGLTLRDVEKATGGGVSNGYLSQLESGVIANPSAAMLHRLAEAYSLDYSKLLAHGGLVSAEASASAHSAVQAPAARDHDVFGNLTPEEERQLLQYLAFLRR